MSNQSEWVYTEKVKDHFMNPRNILLDESTFAEDGKGIVGNIKCGDQMIVYIKVDKEKGIITDCKWKTYGCASAIASTSILSEIVKGMDVEKAYHLSPKDIAGELGGLPENKIHCSVLGDKALRAAINDYYKRNGMAEKVEKEKARIVCQCMNVTDHEITCGFGGGAHLLRAPGANQAGNGLRAMQGGSGRTFKGLYQAAFRVEYITFLERNVRSPAFHAFGLTFSVKTSAGRRSPGFHAFGLTFSVIPSVELRRGRRS